MTDKKKLKSDDDKAKNQFAYLVSLPVNGLLYEPLSWISAHDLGGLELCSLTQYQMFTGCCSRSLPSNQGAGKKILELAAADKKRKISLLDLRYAGSLCATSGRGHSCLA